MTITRRCSLVVLLGLVCVHAQALDLVPMWESYSAVSNDSFYTENPAEHAYSVQIGFKDHGVAFWMPCSQNVPGPDGQPGVEIPNLGFTSDLPMNFACAKPAGAVPLYRLYKGAPATDHFYTTSASDVLGAQEIGYAYEGVEGYIFTWPVSGSVPLYQLSVCFFAGGTCDVEHRYTISADSRDTLIRAGWNDEGVAGYVFDGYDEGYVTAQYQGTMNGRAVSASYPSVLPIRNVTPPAGVQRLQGQGVVGERGIPGAFDVTGYLFSNSTPRPLGAAKQRLAFTLYTGTLFDPGSNLDHIPVMLYFHAQVGSDGLRSNPYDGIGVFFSFPEWGGNACHSSFTSGGQIFVERFADPPDTPYYFDANDCRANLAKPLQSMRYYDVVITADDNAVLDVKVTDDSTRKVLPLAQPGALPYSFASEYACPLTHAAGALDTSMVYCNNPFSPDRFANFRTGYALTPMFQDKPAAVGSGIGNFSNFSVQWLNANGDALRTQYHAQ